ncbi:MAG: peptide-methionine (S)-S-oxide reductase MsrA [Cytophagaceae bacterium]|nr:peptide-methionine (S)-S-oxide reductase MsrA [Gemmatimonadaceae bacterium]
MKPLLPLLLVVAGAVTITALRQQSRAELGLPAPAFDVVRPATAAEQTAYFAGGCFWGVEAVFEHIKGVTSSVSGYAGGSAPNPTYDAVSAGETGHAEMVRVTFDPSKVTYGQLLQVFFSVAHDPTELNRQGPDVGTQYRSMVLFTTAEQKQVVEAYIAQLTKAGAYPRPIVTQVETYSVFHVAEDYHQNYLEAHRMQPYIIFNDLPKLAGLKEEFSSLYRSGVSGK